MISETATKIEEKDLEFNNFSALYRLLKSLYLHIYRAYRGKKGETGFGYRETWNSTTATLVLLRARSGVQLRYTEPMNTMDIYNEKMNYIWEPAPGIERASSA